MKNAWYLKLSETEVFNSAIIVGDKSRLRLIQSYLTEVKVLNEDRGLLTITGLFHGERITVVAFGMGAPIAAVVCHELAYLGVSNILRLGTTMNLGQTKLGEYVLAESAVSQDGTSIAYNPSKTIFTASTSLNASILLTLAEHGITPQVGQVVSCDGFYTEMMSIGSDDSFGVEEKHSNFERLGYVGLDMETAAIFALGERLKINISSLCIATVNGRTKTKLSEAERNLAELKLSLVGLESLTRKVKI